MTGVARPLDRFPLVRTYDVEEMCAALARVYAKPTWSVAAKTGKADVTLNYHPLKHVALGYTKYGVALSGAYPESACYLQTFPLRGRGEVLIKKFASPLGAGRGLTVSPGRRFAAKVDADYEHLLLVFDALGVQSKLGAIIGRPIGRAVEFEPIMNDAHPAAKALRDHVAFLAKMVSESETPLPRLLLEEFEQTLIVMILHANRHNYSQLLERTARGVAPWQVQRAEEFIAANWRRSISLEDIVQATGASAFDLYRSFKKSRGYTPMQFAERLRLGHARELMRQPDVATAVAGVARTCGFGDLGRFERDYVLAFGEPASTTLALGKRERHN
jgi:AraC-like DNA-binding protein